MSSALKRLGAPFPVEGMGLLGDDADGQFLLRICDELGIERSALEVRHSVKTARTIAMTAIPTGKRTLLLLGRSPRFANPRGF